MTAICPPEFCEPLHRASPDAWLTALARFGTMTFEQVIQPALDLVENGHPVDDQFHAFVSGELGGEPSTEAVFNPSGHIPQIGEIFFQKDLGSTFRRMIDAERGAGGNRETGIKAARDLIYKGEIAHEIADFHAQEGGLLTYGRPRSILGSGRTADAHHLQRLRRFTPAGLGVRDQP